MTAKRKTKKIFLAFLCMLIICGVCNAQDEFIEKARKAKQSDIIGTWKMTYQTVSPLFKNKSIFFADRQIFDFSPDGFMLNIASYKKLEAKKVIYLLHTMPKDTSYVFVEDGLLNVKRSENKYDMIVISIATEDFKKKMRSRAPILRKGDLIASYLDNKRNIYMQRYFKRWNPGSK